jgi:hypothetical protein
MNGTPTETAVAGTVVPSGSLTTPGGAQGVQGIQGVPGITDVQPVIWDVRTRSYNAIGNPTMECDQLRKGWNPASANGMMIDRWAYYKGGMGAASFWAGQQGGSVFLPGTGFLLSSAFFRIQLTGVLSALANTDLLQIYQTVEGPQWREVAGSEGNSILLLVRSSVAGLKFTIAIRDSPATVSLIKLCTIPDASTWTLIALPGLLQNPAGNFNVVPGTVANTFAFCLAAGSNYIAPATDSWVSGSYLGAAGMSNFAGSAVNSTFDIAFVQWEPGPICSAPIDLSFTDNLNACLRYFCKSYNYGSNIGASGGGAFATGWGQAGWGNIVGYTPFPKIMAKVPTVTAYNQGSGAANSWRQMGTSTDVAITGLFGLGESGFAGWSCAALPTTNMYFGHYTADTGW